MTKNRRARKLKISENTPRYPYFLVLKFQPDRTWFDPFFDIIFKNREINLPLPVTMHYVHSGTFDQYLIPNQKCSYHAYTLVIIRISKTHNNQDNRHSIVHSSFSHTFHPDFK